MLLDIAFRYRVAIAPGNGPSAFLIPGDVRVAVAEATGEEAPVVANVFSRMKIATSPTSLVKRVRLAPRGAGRAHRRWK